MQSIVRRVFAEESHIPRSLEDICALVPRDELADAFTDNERSCLRDIADTTDVHAPYADLLRGPCHDYDVEGATHVAERIAALGARDVLYAGCGTGLVLAALAQCHPDVRFIASDVSAVPLLCAMRRLGRRGARNVTFVHAAHEELTPALLGTHVDLAFNYCSLDAGPIQIPNYQYLHDDGTILASFVETSPSVARWRRSARAFRQVLRPTGSYLNFGLARGMMRDTIVTAFAREGFSAADDVFVAESFIDDEFPYDDYAQTRMLALPFRPA